ncbi:hypothetical protein ILUMI_05261, partial [Ignelater luminosus]
LKKIQSIFLTTDELIYYNFYFIFFLALLGKLSSVYRLKTALRTDERVRLMNEIISGIQVIKMYTWEKPFAKLVSISRRVEISAIRGASYVRGIYMSFMMFTSRTSLFITILAYVLFGNTINARQVFMVTAFYNVLRQSMTIFFPQGLALIAETKISIDRLNQFLLYEETDLVSNEKHTNSVGLANGITEKNDLDTFINAVSITNGTAKWIGSSNENTLSNLTMNIKRGSLIAVIGPVGSGKTSLLHVILQELPLLMGKLNVSGSISYASQEPWLFTGSVRQNILFGQEMDRMRYKTVISKCALERDFKLLPYADKTIVGERGVSLNIYLLDDPLSAVDTHVGKQLFENCIRDYLGQKTVILITHQLQYLKDVDHLFILKNGILQASGSFDDLQSSGLDFANLLKSEVEEVKEEKPKMSRQSSANRKVSVISTGSTEGNIPQQVEEQRSTGTISSYVYKSYISAGGNCFVVFGVFFLLIIAQVAASLGDYFITYWVNLEQKRAEEAGSTRVLQHSAYYDYWFHNSDSSDFWDFSTETSIYIYAGLTVAVIVLSLTRSFAFFEMCMKASVTLHDTMFNSIILGTMRFFNTNTSGRILNRFSKDMGAVDERLPLALVDCTQIGAALLAIIIVIGTVDPWLLIPTVVMGTLFYFIRVFYLKTSRNIKRLEGVTRSPVFAHLSASLQGLTTIRAFGAQAVLEKEFDNHQDLHSSTWFSFIATATAFGYFLDIICVIYIALITFSFLVLGNETYGGNVGLAITQALGLTGMFQWGMRQTAELENQMTSVERILEYTSVEHEPPLKTSPDKTPPETWPDKGEVKFADLFLYYFPDDPPVLKSLNFTIRPLEKVGIVGRTGAGKSSLIAALFRLTDTKGSIIIDGVDTNNLGLHDLRSKISIIPQEPVLFSGTMRKNLDPFDEYDDEVLWKALEEVELKDVVSDMTSGLNSKMSEGGTNFSVGQRQLVCLARAIIRNNKILVLDEATANVDPQTDALIQHTIRRKFANCTVLTIAHRLHTVMDSDKVLVMDAGTMVQFDHPHILLQDEDGIFYGMVQQTGKAMAETLTKVAEDSYKKMSS